MLFIKMPEMMKMSTPIAVFSSVNIALGVVSISIQVLHFLNHLKNILNSFELQQINYLSILLLIH